MPKTRSVFRCQECGGPSPKWVGRCPSCGEWNTLVEELDGVDDVVLVPAGERAVPIAEVDSVAWQPRSTGSDEVDRVLSGGLVPGSVTLVGGEPGVGKSTLLLQVASSVAQTGATVLYIAAEESPQQVRLRAERLGTLAPEALPGQRDGPAQPAGPGRGGRPRPVGGRLHPDHLRAGPVLGAGLGGPGP